MHDDVADRLSWAREQMEAVNLPEEVRKATEKILGLVWTDPDVVDLTFKQFDSVMAAATELAQSHALAEPEPEAVWTEAKPGTLSVRDIIRVRSNAYSGDAGLSHNGREGVVVAIRYGDIHVRYTDGKEPSFKDVPSIRHSPHALEKRVR